MTSFAYEVQFDTLPGLTHFYGGLSRGNLPSMANQGALSNPRQAALESLEKMKFFYTLGIRQAVFPPHERPFIPALKALGFVGTTEAILKESQKNSPAVLQALSSSAFMWTANSASTTPSVDNADKRVHFTIANMGSHLHRTIEALHNEKLFKTVFPNPVFFAHHAPLISTPSLFDEGAANQMRFCKEHHLPGVQLFVYGSNHFSEEEREIVPRKFPARQSFEASASIARLHQLYSGHYQLAMQNPYAIDAGAFHHDLVAMSNQNLLIIHEKAFGYQKNTLDALKGYVKEVCDTDLQVIEIKESEIPLSEAIKTYLFNSQLVTMKDGTMSLIAPIECQQQPVVFNWLQALINNQSNPISTIHFINLRQSMMNGGGPACLRLRVVLNQEELKEVLPTVFFTEALYERLKGIILRYYPEKMSLEDLSSIHLYENSCAALVEITQALNLGKFYSFQK